MKIRGPSGHARNVDRPEHSGLRRGRVRRREGSITAVHLKLGPLAGVVREALLSAYNLAREGSATPHAVLVVEDVPIVVNCPDCAAEHVLPSLVELRCPVCGVLTADIRAGRGARGRRTGDQLMNEHPRLVEVRQRVLKQNDVNARGLRDRFGESGTFVVSLVSSPARARRNSSSRCWGGSAARIALPPWSAIWRPTTMRAG